MRKFRPHRLLATAILCSSVVGCGDDSPATSDGGPPDASASDAGPPGPAVVTEVGRTDVAPEHPDPSDLGLSLDADGRLLVVFSGQTTDSGGIWATVLDATDPALPVITAATRVDGRDVPLSQFGSRACALVGGGHALVWNGGSPFVRILDGGGAPVSETIQIEGMLSVDGVACLPEGGFAVSGSRRAPAPARAEVVVQRFDASGAPAGEIVGLAAPEGTNAVQGYASLGVDDGGRMVVVFLEVQDAPEASRIIAAEVGADGAVGRPLVLASVTGYGLERPNVSVDPSSGSYLALWLDSDVSKAARIAGGVAIDVALPGVEGVANEQGSGAPLGADRHLLAWHGVGDQPRLVQIAADDSVATDLSVGSIGGMAFFQSPVVARDGRAVVAYNDNRGVSFAVLYDLM